MSERRHFWWIFGVKSGSLLLLMKYVHRKSNLTGRGRAIKIYFMNACPRGWALVALSCSGKLLSNNYLNN